MFPEIMFFGAPASSYWLCMLAGFIAVLISALLLRPKEFPARYVFWLVIILFVFSIIGAVLFGILLKAIAHPGWGLKDILMISGLAYLGAPVLGLIAVWIYCRAIKISFLMVADYAAPFLMLERVFGRLGCLLHGCCYGVRSGLPWAYPFFSTSPGHPTQAYELSIVLAVLISSVYLYRKIADISRAKLPADPANMNIEEMKRLTREAPSAGIVLFYVILAYSSLRFFNEFFRAEGPFLYGPVKVSHLVLILFAVISIIGLFDVIRRSSRKEEIIKALKGSVVRLFAWLVIWLVVILTLITIYNRSHPPAPQYVPPTGFTIPAAIRLSTVAP